MTAPSAARRVGAVEAEVDPGPGGGRLRRLACTGALALRPAHDALYLVGAGAHPIGGDELTVRLALSSGTTATVRTVAATLAREGPDGCPSTQRVDLAVADGASLTWVPEPGIAATRCHHRCEAVIRLSGTARLWWSESILLGRHGDEPVGSWTSKVEIYRDGCPLLVTELGLGPAHDAAWSSPAGLDGARALASLVVVDPSLPTERWAARTLTGPAALGAALPLAGPGMELVAWGDTFAEVQAALAGLCRELQLLRA